MSPKGIYAMDISVDFKHVALAIGSNEMNVLWPARFLGFEVGLPDVLLGCADEHVKFRTQLSLWRCLAVFYAEQS